MWTQLGVRSWGAGPERGCRLEGPGSGWGKQKGVGEFGRAWYTHTLQTLGSPSEPLGTPATSAGLLRPEPSGMKLEYWDEWKPPQTVRLSVLI